MIRRTLTLVVGDMLDWQATGRVPPLIDGFHFADIEDLNPNYMRRLNPEVVLSSLVARKFDAIEIARKLGNMGFSGSYRVLTIDVPNTDLILQEIRNTAPDLDVNILDLADIFSDL